MSDSSVPDGHPSATHHPERSGLGRIGPLTEGDTPLVDVRAVAPEGYTDSCLRPLGLCELGGCCDTCWYGPNNPASPLRQR